MFNTPPRNIITRKQQRELEEQQRKANMSAPPPTPAGTKIEDNTDAIPGTDSLQLPGNVLPSVTKPARTSHASKKSTSCRSRRSTASSIARRKLLEFEAADAKAKIQLALIDKKLEAELAQVDAEESQSESNSEAEEHVLDYETGVSVENWLSKDPHTCTAVPPPDPPCKQPPPTAPLSGNVDSITQLALTLKDMMLTSSAQREDRLLSRLTTPRDLPTFNGDSIEWLHFKSAYDESTRLCKLSDTENLWRLRKALRGDAKEAVTDLLIGNTPPAVVMEALELRFGRPEGIIMNLSSQIKKLPMIPSAYQNDLINFSMKINNFVAIIQALNQDDYLRSPELASAVLSKMPCTLIGKWTDFAYKNLSENRPKLEMIACFLKHEAEMLSLLGIAQICEHKTNEIPVRKRTEDNFYSKKAVLTTASVEENEMCKFCSKSSHPLPECRVFKRAMRRDKWKFVKSKGLCYCCLTSRHDRKECPAPVCDIDKCGLAHHRLLHWSKKLTTTAQEDSPNAPRGTAPAQLSTPSSPQVEPATRATVAHTEHKSSLSVVLKVLSVKLRGPNGVINTHALLDDAASVSIVDAKLASELGLKSEQSSAIKFIDAFGLEVYQSDAPTVSAEISDINNNNFYDIKLRQVSKLKLPVQNLSVIHNLDCQHLPDNIKSKVCKTNVVPHMLIGEDNYHLIVPLEIIHGDKHTPYASRCKLGWSIHGYCGCTHSNAANVFHLAHTDSGNNDEINNLIKHYFSLDSIGISMSRRENSDHLRALQILDETSRLVSNQWEVGLPFQKDVFDMPNSREVAGSRLQYLMHKFAKDHGYADRYRKEINKLFSEGYARELSDYELSAVVPHVWYLPHFGVQNENKPGKLRIVFDAAAKVQGMCLNDYLLTGPDLYNSLMGIMVRFRENKVVIIGDIKDMFLRIKIRSEDQHVLRFLWQESPDVPVKTCAMQSLIFGATCSPFIAQYVKNKNALKYEDMYPEAVQVILNNHYMDDCLYSTSDVSTAIQLVQQITHIHQQGGFEIRGWSSNNKEVLEKIPSDALAQTAVQFKDGVMNITERTLGLVWHPSDDTFGFQVSFNKVPQEILNGTECPTKAKMLSVIMSVYDIHGFLSPFIVKSKIIFQNVQRSGVDWSCQIPAVEHEKWVKWLGELEKLGSLRIPRCYFDSGTWTPCYDCVSRHEGDSVNTPTISCMELHVFCDSSTKAYAAAIYWRFVRSDGHVLVCFAAGKSRVTPLRPVSVPRLELQGALLAARLATTVQSEHTDLRAVKRYFWTDSTTVLQWIRSDPREFKPFVAHRLGELDELTSTKEWRYVPSSQNAADIATREDAPPLHIESVWFQGPSFLRQPENKWPKDLKAAKEPDDTICERKQINVLTSTSPESNVLPIPNQERFSSWNRLLMTTARVLLFISKCQRKHTKLDKDLITKAEELILKKCQKDTFNSEIVCLQKNKLLSKSSRLLKLTPYLDSTGLLRVGGRIDKTDGVRETVKRPVILDGQHRITRLLVEYYHKRALHASHEMVVNELRQNYWILKLRPTVRSVAAHCLFCKYRRAAPQPQRMGDLPTVRLQHNRRPFTCTGVDFFGPMEVTVGRSRQKRYGMLFTCLTIRAVHVEITESLSTDATIMALRRMIARRGSPSVIYSDNGTNLRGADIELKRSIAVLDRDALQSDGLTRGIEWRFIPPGAPEMGGAWERMVRSIKTALRVVLKERAPRPETLSTLMAEVEALVNSRPITHVSSDANYPEALSPNHFLIGTSYNTPVFGKYEDVDLHLRKQWRIAQRLTDMFWCRWVKEYLPTLLPRQRWARENRPLRVGDYVLLVEPNLERGAWRHGVVSAALAGEDGRIRVVDVRTRTNVLRRPVTRVALLSSECGSDD